MPGILLGFSRTPANKRIPTPVTAAFFCANCLWLKCLLLEADGKQVQETTLEMLRYLKYCGLKSSRWEARYSFLKVQNNWKI